MRERARRLLSRLLRLSLREWRDLFLAQLALLSASRTVRRRPVGELVRVNAAPAGPGRPPEHTLFPDPRARELALAVERVAENGPFRPACLVRALAIQQLLESHGVTGSRVRVGVRKRDGRFVAHAWVEYGDLVLGDREGNIAGFSDLAGLEVGTRE